MATTSLSSCFSTAAQEYAELDEEEDEDEEIQAKVTESRQPGRISQGLAAFRPSTTSSANASTAATTPAESPSTVERKTSREKIPPASKVSWRWEAGNCYRCSFLLACALVVVNCFLSRGCVVVGVVGRIGAGVVVGVVVGVAAVLSVGVGVGGVGVGVGVGVDGGVDDIYRVCDSFCSGLKGEGARALLGEVAQSIVSLACLFLGYAVSEVGNEPRCVLVGWNRHVDCAVETAA